MHKKHYFYRLPEEITAMVKTVMVALLTLSLVSCDEESLSLNGKWKLAHYYDTQSGTVDRTLVEEGRSIVLTFSQDSHAGTIHSDSVSGRMLGIYEIGARNRFTFTSLGNAVPADAWSAALLLSISQADFVKISDNSLNISCNKGREVLLFVREN